MIVSNVVTSASRVLVIIVIQFQVRSPIHPERVGRTMSVTCSQKSPPLKPGLVGLIKISRGKGDGLQLVQSKISVGFEINIMNSLTDPVARALSEK